MSTKTKKKGGSVKQISLPLAMPRDLYGDVRKIAVECKLSASAACRLAIGYGLPELRKRLAIDTETN